MARVIYSPDAIEDLQQIWNYIFKQSESSQIADRFIDAIINATSLYAVNSSLGTARDELVPRLRCFSVNRYVIFFMPHDAGIEVVRVMHGARDIPEHFRRFRK